VVEDVGASGGVLTALTEGGDRGPVGGRADEDLVDVFGLEISVCTETHPKGSGERVDENVKKLVLVDFTVRLLWVRRHSSTSGRLQLTSFVRY